MDETVEVGVGPAERPPRSLSCLEATIAGHSPGTAHAE